MAMSALVIVERMLVGRAAHVQLFVGDVKEQLAFGWLVNSA